MKYWLIRTDAPSIEVDYERSTFTIYSKRRPSIKPHDLLVLTSGTYRMLTVAAEVTGVLESTSELEGRATTVRFRVTEKSDEPVELPDLWYSLQAVKNVANPLVHFRRGYRSLTRSDFEALVSGEVFVARTAYFQMLNALPGPMQRMFHASELLRERRARLSYAEKLGRLWDFVSDRILPVGAALRDISASLDALDLSANYRHLFISGENAAPAYLDVQLALFETLSDVLQQKTAPQAKVEVGADLVRRALHAIGSGEMASTQSRFEHAFGGIE